MLASRRRSCDLAAQPSCQATARRSSLSRWFEYRWSSSSSGSSSRRSSSSALVIVLLAFVHVASGGRPHGSSDSIQAFPLRARVTEENWHRRLSSAASETGDDPVAAAIASAVAASRSSYSSSPSSSLSSSRSLSSLSSAAVSRASFGKGGGAGPEAPYDYSSACVAEPPCSGTTYPNLYVYKASRTCACCPPVIVTLELSSPSDQLGNPRITASVADSLDSHVESILGLSSGQVSLFGVTSADASDTATFLVFRNDTLAWSAVDVAEMVNRLRNDSALAAPEFAYAALWKAAAGTATDIATAPSMYYPSGQAIPPLLLASTTPPSAPPSNTTSTSSSSSEVKWWNILLIVLAIVFTGAALAAAGFTWHKAKLQRELLLRQKAQEEEQRKEREEKEQKAKEGAENGDEPGALKDESRSIRKTGSMPTSSSSQSKARSQSDFGLKVQENFVKALSLDEVTRATDNFAAENELGSGGYGTVYKGVSPGGTLWAVKRAKNASEEGIEDFQNEVDVISKMSHRNLVRLLGYCDEKGEQILVYEFVANGTLRQHIRPSNPSKRPLTFEQRLEIAVGAAEGLKYLHSAAEPAIIHRDIKCDNILLDNDMMAKVADFGVFKKSSSNKPGDTMNTRVVGTPGYVDPEYYQTYKVTTKSDVYSFGVVLLELITGRPPIMEDPSVENESYMVTLSRWATPKIAAGKVESILDPRLTGAYPRQALNMMAAVTAMCVRRLGRDRPEMAEVATRLAEIKYFLKPSSGILEPVMNLFPDDDLEDREDNLMDIAEEEEDYDHVPEYIPGTSTGINPYTSADIAAPVSMVFSDR
ncbi:hypothetical protein CLOM_g15314 [Closterium sp. NIES-68]|nr:hypothetical protein CLOM_g15314 [Closterium sp. NIES-68]GJP61385.1 hypothetical protein CLOP_g18553 [Closterium sp. NIES-67]